MRIVFGKYLRFAAALIILGVSARAIASEPMDAVFSLLGQGGVRSGNSALDGYYVVAMGTARHANEAKGLELARLDALRQLSEMINGIHLSGSSYAASEYVTQNDAGEEHSFSKTQFVDVVNQQFSGNLSAVKMLKSGQYDDAYFVALVITEQDVIKLAPLRSAVASSAPAKQALSVATFSEPSVSDEVRVVEAKGLASMKKGEAQARELALLDAMKNAISQVQGVMLSGKSGQFNDALSVAISSKTQGYVSSYEILDENIERGQYHVIVAAEVNAGQLLNDASFYLDVFGNARFSVVANDAGKTDWLSDTLENLGFSFTQDHASATHRFELSEQQKLVEDHKGSQGIETALTLRLLDNVTQDVILSINNAPQKTRIYVEPTSRARQVSSHQAYKQLSAKLGPELIQSLARYGERGVLYPIVINNANRHDLALFKHVLENATEGRVAHWAWDAQGKTLSLYYRFSGSLSQAFDQGLDSLYATFKREGKGRRPHMLSLNDKQAHFEMR